MSARDEIKLALAEHPHLNRSELARALDVSRAYVSKVARELGFESVEGCPECRAYHRAGHVAEV